MVAFARGCSSWIKHISGVRHMGGLSERLLHLRPLYFPFLFARNLRQFSARFVRPKAAMVSQFSAVFSGAAHSLDTGPIPCDVLLLPGRVLKVFLGGSPSLRGKRAAQDIPWRTALS